MNNNAFTVGVTLYYICRDIADKRCSPEHEGLIEKLRELLQEDVAVEVLAKIVHGSMGKILDLKSALDGIAEDFKGIFEG